MSISNHEAKFWIDYQPKDSIWQLTEVVVQEGALELKFAIQARTSDELCVEVARQKWFQEFDANMFNFALRSAIKMAQEMVDANGLASIDIIARGTFMIPRTTI